MERNDAYLMADFLTKRGQHPVVGATHSPPRDFNFDSCSAVLGCFIKALAIAKVGAMLPSPCGWHCHCARIAMAMPYTCDLYSCLKICCCGYNNMEALKLVVKPGSLAHRWCAAHYHIVSQLCIKCFDRVTIQTVRHHLLEPCNKLCGHGKVVSPCVMFPCFRLFGNVVSHGELPIQKCLGTLDGSSMACLGLHQDFA